MKLVWLCAIFTLIVVAHRCDACWPTKMPKAGARFLNQWSGLWFTRFDGVGSCDDASAKGAPLDNENTLDLCLTHCARRSNCTFVVFELQNGASSIADDVIFGNDGQARTGWHLAKGACFDFYCAEIRFWKMDTIPLQAMTFLKDNVSIVTGEQLRFPQASNEDNGDDGERKTEINEGLPGGATNRKQTSNEAEQVDASKD